jgi:UDP-N-acetylmuramoylalanine--D-glutamate ligase
MIEGIKEQLTGKKLAILGFGREGQASYSLIRKLFPDTLLLIADRNTDVAENPFISGDTHLELFLGERYLDVINSSDLLIKSPGIRLNDLDPPLPSEKILTQTGLFLQHYARQVIGITGTKGKSTTSSLIFHILRAAGKEAFLAGNIGSPVFNYIDRISDDTTVVFELSSHQLEYVKSSPHIAVFLNLFQEHLDAYSSYEDYQQAKVNIARFQSNKDYLVYHSGDVMVDRHVHSLKSTQHLVPFELKGKSRPGVFIDDGYVCFSDGISERPVWKLEQKRYLKGEHNLKNIMAATGACCISGVPDEAIREGILTFKGLEHRLEYVGEYRKIHFYNDSIATIPEAAMEAVKSIPNTDTIILGGFDRGIDYKPLADFLSASTVRNIILTGDAGKRIGECLKPLKTKGKKIFYINRFELLRDIVFRETRPGYACLLSPAAASYDEFANFEERGKRFRELIKSGH